MQIDPIDVSRLEVATEIPDLRRDLHVFVDYVRTREVKRSHRGNELSKSDTKRLARLCSDPRAVADAEKGYSTWIEFVDAVALRLGFVHYDTQGKYAGYSSQEPSFPNNFIEYRAKPYESFLAAKTAQQEATLLDALLSWRQGSNSEFYITSALGQLDGFSCWGAAVGVMPTLDFPAVRRFLLGLLAECPCGPWLSTASLVEYLKYHHRHFLIPAKPQVKKEHASSARRYDNFHESKDSWGHEIDILDSDPDGFERVEGRYVERFLEGIPLVLRYVDVAYAKPPAKSLHPTRGLLPAFRVSERLRRALEGSLAEPRVTVTPNFEIHVISETYPAGVLAQLAPLCEKVSEGASTVLKLTKAKVAAAQANSPDLDAAGLLRRLCSNELPANIAHELSAWAEHGEKFVLYANCCVLETEQNVPAADRFTVEAIAEGIRLVRSSDKLFTELERRELVPVRIQHGNQAFTPLPKNAVTRFPKGSPVREKSRGPKPAAKLIRLTRVQLVCPNHEVLDKLHGLLMGSQCPVEMDRPNLTLSYSKQYESAVGNAIRQLKTEYQLEIEDLAS